jgi:hypothetical protein
MDVYMWIYKWIYKWIFEAIYNLVDAYLASLSEVDTNPVAAVMNCQPRWRYPCPPIAILTQQAPACCRLESHNRHLAYF